MRPPKVDSFPWPASKRAVRAAHTARQLGVLVAEHRQGVSTEMHERALWALEHAARVMWGDTWETRIEAMACHLDGALAMRRFNRSTFDDLKRMGWVPPHVDRQTWERAVDAWHAYRDRRRTGGGRWVALGLVFDEEPEALARRVRKIRAKR